MGTPMPIDVKLEAPLPRGRVLDLGRPRVMGVLNVTPDSFSDGGRHVSLDAAVARAFEMAEEGADVVDVGGESTRPGAREVPEDEERRRVLPVIEALEKRGFERPISIDTRRAVVARDALAAGASIVNDVTALRDEAMAGVVARARAAVILMHMKGTPETMQGEAVYDDVVASVTRTLEERVAFARSAGIQRECVLVDPGLGFAKKPEHNWALLARLDRLAAIAPVVVGASRKSFLGALLGGRPPLERASAGLGVAVAATLKGARVVRTHDVRATVDALAAAWEIVERSERCSSNS
jgi:dihydropteroate synthase